MKWTAQAERSGNKSQDKQAGEMETPVTLWEIFNKHVTIWKTEYMPSETIAFNEISGRCQNIVCYTLCYS